MIKLYRHLAKNLSRGFLIKHLYVGKTFNIHVSNLFELVFTPNIKNLIGRAFTTDEIYHIHFFFIYKIDPVVCKMCS